MPAKTVSKTAPRYTPQFPFETPEKGSLLDMLRRAHTGLRSRLEDFDAKSREIGADVMLSIEGRKAQIAAVAKDQLRRIEAISSEVLPRTERRIEQLENGLRTQGERAVREDPVAASRAQSILHLLEDLDASQRLAECKAALDNDERETLAAIATAPKLWQKRFIQPAIVEVLEKETLRRANPAAHNELEQLRDAVTVVKQTAQAVESYIRAESGLEIPLRERLEEQAEQARKARAS